MNADFATREKIAAVERLIRPHIRRTPVIEARGEEFGFPGVLLVFKLELCQHAGAFKARGAFANLLLRKPGPAGVAAASGGNHGAAVAFAAQQLGLKARIFVPATSSPAKIARIRRYNAALEIGGERYADAAAACADYASKTGALNIHPYDAPETILGAGTTGMEFDEQASTLDTVLVAVGGGGLVAGVSAWFRGGARVIGVEPELSPCLHRALAAGAPVDAPAGGLAGDSLGASRIGALAFAVAGPRIAGSVLVADEAIRAAQKALWATLQVAAEPGAAAPLAALLSGAYKPETGEVLGLVISGGNTTAVDFDR